MKRNEFNKPIIRQKSPQPIYQIGNGRLENELKNKITELTKEIESNKILINRISKESTNLHAITDNLNSTTKTQKGELETLRAVKHQLELDMSKFTELKFTLEREQAARKIAEAKAAAASAPVFASIGAIERVTGFQMPAFGDIIPRKSLGNSSPNLVRYIPKEITNG